ncbi:hypothetical protein [Azospirillum rugosum]|uniref:DUF2188 domain-containing protein n=1 Tax=Azospirillum rugosum TaxID=416170 RepID=A0ABS4STX1_9PROT|nr:hypothetical protein [Azospirillum rugosum]MBP2295553.1 hypothetical protein [Azospirillum rugosum]MDQ0528432.1 hypothetical protein [Azospirillum rugosum]
MRTKAELLKPPEPEAPPPGIRITSGRTKDEIGRVHHADGAWTAFARDADGRYRTVGAHPDFAAALSAIPDAPAPEEREAPKATAPKPRRQTAATMAKPDAGRTTAPAQAAKAQSAKAQSGKPRAVRSKAA